MAIEIVDFPIKKKVIFHSYVSLPEGTNYDFQWGRTVRENSEGEQWGRYNLYTQNDYIVLQSHGTSFPKIVGI